MQDNGYYVPTFGVYTAEFQEKTRKYRSSVFRGIGFSELLNFTIARVFTGIFVSSENLLEDLDLLLLTDFDSGKANARELISKITASNSPRWKRELMATVIELESYIRELKELNIFENSVVVFKSDHGKPVSYYEPGTIEAEAIHGHSLWGYGRYEPFLAIKAPGPGRFALKNNPSPVMLDDLARSICMVSLDASLCTRYPGFDLSSEDLSIPESAEVTLFVVRSDCSDFKFDSHDAVTVRRQASILKNLYQSVTGRKFLEN